MDSHPCSNLRSRRSRASSNYEASASDVLKKIVNRVRDFELAKRLTEKVLNYKKTKNDRDDLTKDEASLIYRQDDYGDVLPITKKKNIDIGWTDHAEYRSDLRDVNPDKVNDAIRNILKNRLNKPEHKDVRLKAPGVGTFVVDYDTRKKEPEADVITVWASDGEINFDQKESKTRKGLNSFGLCPLCFSNVYDREDGKDICWNGHSYKSNLTVKRGDR